MKTAILLARKGSKGILSKNIRDFAGKPLIAWSIEAALKSKIFHSIILSTDCPEIQKIGERWGATALPLRPAELSHDETNTLEVLAYLFDQHTEINEFTLLQPTSPLRTAQDIQLSWKFYDEKAAGAVVSVCEEAHSPLLSFELAENLSLYEFGKNLAASSPRQKLAKTHRINGAIYSSSSHYVKEHNGFYGEKTFAFVMPIERSVDIDTPFDFKVAEFLLQSQIEDEE